MPLIDTWICMFGELVHVAIDTSFCEHSLKIDRFVSRNQQQLQKNVNPLCKVQSVNSSLSVGTMF